MLHKVDGGSLLRGGRVEVDIYAVLLMDCALNVSECIISCMENNSELM